MTIYIYIKYWFYIFFYINCSLCEDIQSSRQHLHNVEQRSKSLEDRVNQLQKELSQAIALSAKFQEKVEKLENESTKNSK